MLQLLIVLCTSLGPVFWDLGKQIVQLCGRRDGLFARVDDANAEVRGATCGLAEAGRGSVDVEVYAEWVRGSGRQDEGRWR